MAVGSSGGQANATREINEVETRTGVVKRKDDQNKVDLRKRKRKDDASVLRKHYVNIREILKHSNATPIRSRGGIGYACSFCTDQYPDPADLKRHTLEIHNDLSKASFMQRNRLFEYFVRLDITELICKICGINIDTLENLMAHLKSDHQIKIFTDIKNHILPFKFETKSLQCFMCLNVFNKFKSLLEHMNSHYKNYVCNTCQAGFVNMRQLTNHRPSHKTGTFKCGYCDKVFDTQAKRRGHEKGVHIYKNVLHKCGYCNERFTLPRLKDEHLKSVHGVRISFNCQACDKTFNSTKLLNSHTKRDHLMERFFKCKQCDKEFFAVGQLKNHMLSHTGEREYKCDVCLKSYGRKYTLKEHMRIHADDRRFKCEHCGQAFVQKCVIKKEAVIVTLKEVKTEFNEHTNEKKKKVAAKAKSNIKSDGKIGEELEKHRHNARLILLNSNATPIRAYQGIGYCCCFCAEQFPNPGNLKRHTLDEHDDKSKSKFMKGSVMAKYSVKLDITGLSCLLEHMSVHYKNYNCDKCDAGFVNRSLLYRHSLVHVTGNFKCNYCDSVFETLPKSKHHERKAHRKTQSHKCGYCNERFKENYKKIEHLIEVHGIKQPGECQACDKKFATTRALRQHLKRYHLLEKNYKCSQCPMGFFTGVELNYHMVKHTGEKQFQCGVCYKSYGRKKTLKEHMRIHNNDRKFKCQHCGQAFVQKCSLKGHLRSKHGKMCNDSI
ncbi:zinc finger protein 208-like [Galleria mellonella]|uniref:Zinc finger protein 208-like n=1 Tax=Galleria mellonella TaxID=7137 RepID=A0ABM3N0S1_GALME|nr:zinc finger protein 208-like [Galleria mellonella]